MNHRRRLDRLEGTAPDQGVAPVTAITICGICAETREAVCAFTWPTIGAQINHSDRTPDETETAFLARIDAEIEGGNYAT